MEKVDEPKVSEGMSNDIYLWNTGILSSSTAFDDVFGGETAAKVQYILKLPAGTASSVEADSFKELQSIHKGLKARLTEV